jgi:prevent-host-death family protein
MKAAAAQPEVRTVSAAEFKAKCLQLMDEVKENNLTISITKRGKPVCRVVPLVEEEKPFVPLWGRSPNVKILGDIISPLPQEWTLPSYAWEKEAPKHKSKGKKKK